MLDCPTPEERAHDLIHEYLLDRAWSFSIQDMEQAIAAAIRAAVADAEAERDAAVAKVTALIQDYRDCESLYRAAQRERDAALKRLHEILYRIVVELDIDDSTDTDSPDAIIASVAGFMEDLNSCRARAKALATALERIQKKGGDAR